MAAFMGTYLKGIEGTEKLNRLWPKGAVVSEVWLAFSVGACDLGCRMICFVEFIDGLYQEAWS